MKKSLKEQLAKVLLQRLENEYFEYHLRLVREASHYGTINEEDLYVPNTDMVEERWENKEFIKWLLDVGNGEISNSADEIRKILED